MKRMFCFALCVIGLTVNADCQNKGAVLVQDMITYTKSIDAVNYTMRKSERIDGKLIVQQSSSKFKKVPFSVYVKQISPKAGVEVLYVEGVNNNKALVNPNGFPWVNLSLDPLGSIMREDQHHTLFDSGYDLFMSILEHLISKFATESNSMIKMEGIVKVDNRNCHKIVFDNFRFEWQDYVIKNNETLAQIADREKLCEYMIRQQNGFADDDKPANGTTIKLANSYAPKLILFIDENRKIPMKIEVYDSEGLFEKYDYSNVTINPNYQPGEFNKDYKDYGF